MSESIKKEELFDPYIKMETALSTVEGSDSTEVYEVPICSRQPSPVGDTASQLLQEGDSCTAKGVSDASAGQSEKTDISLFIEDDYVNPALFRKEAEGGLVTRASPVDASIYESMVTADPNQGYKVKQKQRANGKAETSGEKAEGARPLLPFDDAGLVAVNSELRRTYTADNQYVAVRPQIARRNASQPDLDIEDPYSNLSDLYFGIGAGNEGSLLPSARAPERAS